MHPDLWCYAALAVNLAAMSMSSQRALRLLSLLANALLTVYAVLIGATALSFAAAAVIVVHAWHLQRIQKSMQAART